MLDEDTDMTNGWRKKPEGVGAPTDDSPEGVSAIRTDGGERDPDERDLAGTPVANDPLFGGPGAEAATRRQGWLTTRDREVLLGESDLEEGTDEHRRARLRLRNRVIGGFLDAILLERHMDARDRELVFDRFDVQTLLAPDPKDRVQTEVNKLDHLVAIDHLFAFLWRGLKGRNPSFRDRLEGGIIRGEHNPGPGTPAYDNYRVSLAVEELTSPPAEGIPINYAELSAFLEPAADDADTEELGELLDAIRTHDPSEEEIAAAIHLLAGGEGDAGVDSDTEGQE